MIIMREVAEAIVWLCSHAASFETGSEGVNREWITYLTGFLKF
jgi:hypothetical protein